MSQPRYYWYHISKRMIYKAWDINNCNCEMEYRYNEAITRALLNLSTKSYPDMRVKAIEEVLFKNRKTVIGVADEMGFSDWTVQKWLQDFVKDVGYEVGYLNTYAKKPNGDSNIKL